MSSSALIPQSADVLIALLDEMATSLMIFGTGGVTVEQVDSLAVEAQEHGFVLTACAARALVESIGRSVSQDDIPTQVSEEDLAQLRALLKRDRGAAPMSEGPVVGETPLVSVPTSFAADREFMTNFISEAREHLSSIESQMLQLESDPDNTEVLNSVFRAFHTIKGLAGFFEFDMIQNVSHQVETLLDLARNKTLIVSSPVVDLILESADYLKGEVDRIEREVAGSDRTQSVNACALIKRFEQLILATGESGALPQLPDNPFSPGPVAEGIAAKASPASGYPEAVPVRAAEIHDVVTVGSENTKLCDNSSVRVETAKLDQLLDMVGEMVIAQSLIRNNPALVASSDPRLLGDIAQLSRNTADVQRITMGMRMIPIGQLFSRTARLIRDLSRKAGKQIILETIGEETEVDKAIAEELYDPLLHMVRNAIDHGIETPLERAATGKDLVARIGLKAYHRAGQIVIEISDDGRGLNREKILAKAVDRGLIESGSNLSDAEVYHLIFEPGFSTAEQISDVSGRGVGMDVVRRNVQKLRGRIDIQSTQGQGTTFSLKLPLTLAIIDGLVVVVGASRYIVPLFAVREMFRPTREMLSTVQGRTEMALVRGKLLPVTRLNERLGIPGNSVDATDGFLVVTESADKQFCLLVDDLVGKQEVVIKGLGEAFKEATGLAGCAILGDGRIGLILDMEGIYRGSAR